MFYLFVIPAFAFPTIIGASVAVRYKIHSPQNGVDIAQCGRSALGFGFCGVRVISGVCEPLTTDWCESKTMSPDDVYLVKDIVMEKLQEPTENVYERQLPISLNEGSEFELKVTAHSDWAGTEITLFDSSSHMPFYIAFRHYNLFVFNSFNNGGWSSEIYNAHPFSVDVETTMTIVCGTDGFEMFVDGVQEWTFPYRQPALTARSIEFKTNAPKDIHQITFKAA